MQLSYFPLSEQQRRWSDCAHAQAGLCLCCSHATKSGFTRGDSQLLSVDHLSQLTDVFIISPHELTTIKEIVGVEFLNFDIFDAEPLCNIQHQCLVCIRNVLETQKEEWSQLILCVSYNRPRIKAFYQYMLSKIQLDVCQTTWKLVYFFMLILLKQQK